MSELLRRLSQLYMLLEYLVARIITISHHNKKVFLICERGTDARDNGYFFFEYLKKCHNEIESYYIITKDSPDRKKLEKYGDSIVTYRSFRNYRVYSRATHLISTHVHGYHPEVPLFNRLENVFGINRKKYCISLKHGITKDYIPGLQYSETKLDLLICGAKPEYDYMKQTYGYPDNNLQYTGFCRFDRLMVFKCKKQILVMPTWRNWLNKDNFLESEYYEAYSDLLTDKNLHQLLEENDLTLVFYPHHELQPYVHHFKKAASYSRIVIADKNHFDVQTLLKESLLLITDYSSVFFDFAYMRKPIIYYQFDIEKYREVHYSQGYFRYEEGFGPLVTDQADLIREIEENVINDCKMADYYLELVDEYFPLHDSNNCERVFNSILSLEK